MTLISPWIPPVHAIQPWRDRSESTPTALSSANLMTAETDGVNDSRAVGQDLRTNLLSILIPALAVSLGNIGSTAAIDLQDTPNAEVFVIGTLTANAAITVSNYKANTQVIFLLNQDATGSRTLTINGVSTTVPAGANKKFGYLAYFPANHPTALTASTLHRISGIPDYIVDASGVASGNIPWSLGSNTYGWGPPAYPVTSVFGRTGAVVKTAGDYTAADVTNAADKSSGATQVFTGGISATSGAFSSAVSAAEVVAPVIANTQTGNYILVLGDAGRVIEMNVGSANTLTIPPHSSVAFPVGTVIEVYQMGAGQTTLTPGAGVTIRSDTARLKTAAQYAVAGLRQRATDEWVASGDLTT